MQLSIDDDMLDVLIQKRLASDFESLKKDFLAGSGIPMYSNDRELERELFFTLIQAIRTVHNYYAVPLDKIVY